MTAALIVGDLHLGKSPNLGKPGIGTALNSRIIDQINLLDWLLDQAMEYNVELIVLTGDIFQDVKPDYTVVNIFFDFLKKCEIYNFEVHIVTGNHDIKRTGLNYSSILEVIDVWDTDHIFVYKQFNTIHKNGVSFTLMPFRDRRSLNCDSNLEALNILAEKLPYEVTGIPLGNDRVLIGHLALEGSLPVGDEFDDYNNELLCPLNMFEKYDYVWMGHIHKPQVRSKKPYIAHIGSLDISDFGETDHQKIVVVYDSGKSEKFQEILVPSRPLRKIELTIPPGSDTTTYVLEQLQILNEVKSLKKSILKLELKLVDAETSNVDRSVIEEYLTKLGVHYLCNFSESRKITVVPITKQVIENTIEPKQAIKLYAEQLQFDSEEMKQEYIKLAIRLIDDYHTSIKN